MAQPTTESERVTAFREPRQQLQTQVSDSICDAEEEFQARSLIASIRRGTTLLLARRLRRPSAAACLLALTVALQAQTAQFAGVQSTVSTGLSSAFGVAVDGSGNIYVADSGNSRVLMETLSGGAYTQSVVADASAAYGLQGPRGVAVDGSGNVYITDVNTNRVLKETLSGGAYTQSVVADSGVDGLLNPEGVAVDGSDNVYIADTGNGRVLKETLSAGNYAQSTLGSGLSTPYAVAVDGSGTVYIADSGNNRVVLETLSSGSYTQSILFTGLNHAQGVAVDGSGNVYVTVAGIVSFPFFYPGLVLKETLSGGSYTQSTLRTTQTDPIGVAVDGSGNVYIAGTSSVLKLQTAGADFGSVNVGATSSVLSLAFTFATAGTGITEAVSTQGAPGLDFSDAGTGSCDTNGAGFAYEIGQTCTVDVTFAPTLASPRYGAAVLKNGSGVVIATGYVSGVGLGPQVNFLPGTLSTVAGRLTLIYGATVDASGNVYIVEQGAGLVLK